MKTAFFPGSFNPFTIGHKSIAERALRIADRLIIGVGYNCHKSDNQATAARIQSIADIFADDDRIQVVGYTGLTVDAVKQYGADYMVRGIRSVADFEYERNLADANLDISGIETILITSLPEYSYISSSMVRELEANGHDVTKYLAK